MIRVAADRGRCVVKRGRRIAGGWLLAIAGGIAALTLGGCNAIHGLGTDLQIWSDQAQVLVTGDDPVND